MNDYADTITRLVEYEVWCTIRAIDALTALSEGELSRDFGFGLRTPHRTIFHIANVMRTWSSCVGPVIKKRMPLEYQSDMSLAEIRAMVVRLGEAWFAASMRSHIQGLLDKDRRLHQLFHLITHGTHHRSQLLAMLSLMGYAQPFEGGDFGGWSNETS
jgi:uncharacterized damage-inducible protein DinB